MHVTLITGYTYRMRVLPFAQRYFAFNDGQLTQDEALDIVRSYQKMVIEERKKNPNNILYLGRKHVFFRYGWWNMLYEEIQVDIGGFKWIWGDSSGYDGVQVDMRGFKWIWGDSSGYEET